jgi:hypothetical protein
MTTQRERSTFGPSIAGSTVVALIAALGLAAWIDGARGVIAGGAGALVALLVQGVAAWLVLRRWRDSDAAFLGAFAGAMDALAKATEGYSGRDISGIVSGANMPMLGLLEQAEYFRRVTAPSADDSKVLCDDMLEPCDKNDVGAFPKKEKDLSETERKKVVLPKLTLERVLASVQSTKKSVSAKTVKKCAEWKEK